MKDGSWRHSILIVCCIYDAILSTARMVSNVPGPKQQVSLGGLLVEDIHFLTCLPIGLYCGLLTYNGMLSMQLCCDSACGERLDLFAQLWNTEFDEFYAEIMDTPGPIEPPRNVRGELLLIIVLLCLGALGYLLYYFLDTQISSAFA